MEKYISFFRKTFIMTGLLTIILIVLDLLFKISLTDISGIYTAFTSLVAILFFVSLYVFFVLSDVLKNRFVYLSRLNYFVFGLLLLISSYWIFNFDDARLGIAYTVIYFFIFIFVNLVLMTIVYQIKRTGGDSIFKEWLCFFGLIAVCVMYLVFVGVMR